eukprot:3498800-Amphidinium_carterae.1
MFTTPCHDRQREVDVSALGSLLMSRSLRMYARPCLDADKALWQSLAHECTEGLDLAAWFWRIAADVLHFCSDQRGSDNPGKGGPLGRRSFLGCSVPTMPSVV